jgi:hypothetical protein
MRIPLPGPDRRRARALIAAGALVAGVSVVPIAAAATSRPAETNTAAAVQFSTTAEPAGHEFTASLASGVASFTVGSVSVNCDTSSTSGTIPEAPNNTNPDGPVTGPITPPEFANAGADSCPTNIAFTTATSTTSGDWTISLQFDPAGSTGTLNIPQNGLVAEISGLATCTITTAPNGPAAVVGSWVPGSPPALQISNVSVPITVTGGFGCPTAATEAQFSAVYQVVDTTDPTQFITVTGGPAGPTQEPTPTGEPTPSPTC